MRVAPFPVYHAEHWCCVLPAATGGRSPANLRGNSSRSRADVVVPKMSGKRFASWLLLFCEEMTLVSRARPQLLALHFMAHAACTVLRSSTHVPATLIGHLTISSDTSGVRRIIPAHSHNASRPAHERTGCVPWTPCSPTRPPDAPAPSICSTCLQARLLGRTPTRGGR